MPGALGYRAGARSVCGPRATLYVAGSLRVPVCFCDSVSPRSCSEACAWGTGMEVSRPDSWRPWGSSSCSCQCLPGKETPELSSHPGGAFDDVNLQSDRTPRQSYSPACLRAWSLSKAGLPVIKCLQRRLCADPFWLCMFKQRAF